MTTATRIGRKQATRLLQLSAGYMIARENAYADLEARGLVEVSTRYRRGDVEYERQNGVILPSVTWDGRRALREFVDRNGRLEVEVRDVLADYTTVIRMDPAANETATTQNAQEARDA